MTTGIAVIGAGLMGRDHALRLSGEIAGAHVSVLADLDRGRAEEVAAETEALGAPRPIVLTDARAALEHPESEAVIIASHDSTHADLVLGAIDRDLPVLCEKPLAPTVEECQEIVAREGAAAAKTGRQLVSVAFMRRFDAGCLQLRDAVLNGAHGAALMAHCIHRNVDPYPGGSDHTITGSAIHEFDFLPWVLGSPITEVAWLTGRSSSRTTRLDPQLLLLRLSNGVLVTLEMFVSSAYGYEVGCEIVFERGTTRLINQAPIETRSERIVGQRFHADALRPYADAYRSELQTWIRSLNSKDQGPALANAWDGLQATAAATTMVQAMTNADGRFLKVPVYDMPSRYDNRIPQGAA